jgi:hypothetical protein
MNVAYTRSDEYRIEAEECWDLADHAEDEASRAVFQLTAEAWTRLAEQVERLRRQQPS